MLHRLAQPQLHGTSSKHSSAIALIKRGLYDNLHSFAELEQRISNLGEENTKIVGDAFEIFVEAYLATHQKLQAETVWLVGQVPLEIRKQLNLPRDAKGIDGVFKTRIGTLVPYQVKFRSQRAYLTYTEIAPFLGLTERATDRIVFTNSNELAPDVKNRDAMRTVRGIDFDDLTEEDFAAIYSWLRERPVAIQKPPPYSYQITALEKIRETFAKSDRAHVVMACGTGKTLVALWAVEQLNPKTVLVLVPSLTLLQQTLDEWSRHNTWGNGFSYICVCSDPTVTAKDENDPITFHRSDAEFRVDTDPDTVRQFVKRDTTNIKVIFSTYQSCPIVSQGIAGLAPIDVAVFDEAHKTTGPKGGLFAHCLSDENIRIRKRLFLTATPRHYDIRHRNREGDFRIISMDDETSYGPRAYTLTFGSAAREGIICKYKVVISVVDGNEVNDFALKHGITLVQSRLISAKWVANQIAVERAIEETRAVKGITFHSRVSGAKEFCADTSRGIKQWLPDFSVFHVNGDQKSSERKQRIRSFREAPKALITNARCLTEGIDVPAVDMVAFIDPRHSRIDIAQATGRAMRKPKGSDKEIGYVVVPLFLERQKGETLEQALQRSEFYGVANVLNAMQEQDEDLVQIIREMQEAKGRGEIFNPRRLTDKIKVLGPSIELSTLRSNIFAEVVESIGVSWDLWYGLLRKYKEREGDCRVPHAYKENGHGLGQWVLAQRQQKDTLSEDRRRRLDDLGFLWNPLEVDWEEGFNYLTIYQEREGHCDVPRLYTEGAFKLGQWVGNQRANKDNISGERRKRLDAIGFLWDVLQTRWQEGFAALTTYKAREGHCDVPALHTEGRRFKLGQWVTVQRSRNREGIMSCERKQQLDAVGFLWDVLEAKWEEGFAALKTFKALKGHCNVPTGHDEGTFKLGQWVNVQRNEKDVMSAERKQQLDAVGFVWDARKNRWEEMFAALKTFKAREGHCDVPKGHDEDGFKLGNWVDSQRANKNISPERRKWLDNIGFVWDPFEAKWEEGFAALKTFKARERHCNVPMRHDEGTFKLGRWAEKQRTKRDTMRAERRKRLDAIGFVWNALEKKWEEGFAALKTFKAHEGHCNVPDRHAGRRLKLGMWVGNQRANQDNISPERKKRLDNIGFVWDPFEAKWEEGFAALRTYKTRERHCNVPQRHDEGNFKLGGWINRQRANKRTMPADRKKRLDKLGFVWRLRKRKSH
jgi:superfamily II DNA or RNA helicase